MFWADRTTKLAGIALVVLALLMIGNIVFSMIAVGDADPTNRGEIEGVLRDVNDHETVFYTGAAFSIASDAVVLVAVAGALYLTFVDRSRMLAILSLGGILAASIAFLVMDAATLGVGLLAADFVEKGGPAAIPAGDASILESARTLALFGGALDVIGSTAVALGVVSLGALIAWAPEGRVNPPRWLGGVAILSGLALVLQWPALANEASGMVVITVGYAGGFLFFGLLGLWLLAAPGESAEPRAGGQMVPGTAG